MSVETDWNKQKRIMDNVIGLLNPDITHADLVRVGEEAKEALIAAVQANDSVGTGDLISKFTVVDDGNGQIRIVNTSDHVQAFEYGHGPIRPVNAKALRFIPKGETQPIFRKYVGPTDGAKILDSTVLVTVPKSIEQIMKEKGAQIDRIK